MTTIDHTFALAAVAAACLATLGGCAATTSPQWDSEFGDRARLLASQQRIDPAATARNGQNTPRDDGRTVREAGERHVESFRAPPAPSVISIGVGAGR